MSQQTNTTQHPTPAAKRVAITAIPMRWHAGKACSCGARTTAFGSVNDAHYGRNGLSFDKRGEVVVTCSCGQVRKVRAVRGVISAQHKCGARCLNATGHDCECECGGANHGAGSVEVITIGGAL